MADEIQEGLQPNSFKKKEEEKRILESPEPGKLTAVTKARIVVKKKNWLEKVGDALFGSDTNSVANYIFYEVLIPAAKDTIEDMVTGGLKVLLRGDARGSRSSRDHGTRISYIDYGGYGRDRDRDRDRDRRPIRDTIRVHSRYNFSDLIIDTRREAEDVLAQLVELIDTYKVATVADFYDLLGINDDYSDNKYGWRNLSRAYVDRVRDGYVLVLPRPEPLD